MSEVNLVESQPHYSYVTRSAIRLFNQGTLPNVIDVIVEPEYGYTARLAYDDGSFRVTYGNDLGLNSGAACDLAKDKGHSRFMLDQIGVTVPVGNTFILPWWADKIREGQSRRGNTNLRTIEAAPSYIESIIGYPAYIKPVSGSKGVGVTRIENAADLPLVFESYNNDRVTVAIVEQAVPMPDYRVVMLDGELQSAYLRKPLAVTGDGRQTIRQLLDQLQQSYTEDGRDTILNPHDARIGQRLGKLGLTLATTLPASQEVTLLAISNLSAGGTSEDITVTIDEQWVRLCAFVARNFNLRLCGVDLACSDITSPAADYAVLEVNAAPGLDHYASAGETQQQIVDKLYAKVLNAYPATVHKNVPTILSRI